MHPRQFTMSGSTPTAMLHPASCSDVIFSHRSSKYVPEFSSPVSFEMQISVHRSSAFGDSVASGPNVGGAVATGAGEGPAGAVVDDGWCEGVDGWTSEVSFANVGAIDAIHIYHH